MKDQWQVSRGGETWTEPVEVETSSKGSQLVASLEGEDLRGQLRKIDGHSGMLSFGENALPASWSRDSRGVWISIQGQTFLFRRASTHQGADGDSGSLTSPMPARVLKILVDVGEAVEEGQELMRLEAMKMEHSLKAPTAGTVQALHAKEGDQVEAGLALVEIS